MKKTLSFILAAITAMSIGTAAMAAEAEPFVTDDPEAFYSVSEETVQNEIYEEQETVTAEETAETVEEETEAEAAEAENPLGCFKPEKEDPNEPLVTMYLCATAHSLTGHVWLYFENICEKEIPVGYITLAPGEQTSVGSLRNTRTDGGGTYYNGEAYMSKNIDTTGEHTTYLSMNLNRAQLETVNEQIKKRNSYNLLVWNCGNFATAVWNSVSSHHFIHICFPIFTILQMAIHGAKKGFTMSRPTIDKCFKQVSGGVVPAAANSFNSSCV